MENYGALLTSKSRHTDDVILLAQNGLTEKALESCSPISVAYLQYSIRLTVR